MVVPSILPVDPPKHKTLVTTALYDNGFGWEIITLIFSVHPLASVTFTEYVPANNPLTSSVDAPLLHAKE